MRNRDRRGVRFTQGHTATKAGVGFGPGCLALVSIDSIYCLIPVLSDHQGSCTKFSQRTHGAARGGEKADLHDSSRGLIVGLVCSEPELDQKSMMSDPRILLLHRCLSFQSPALLDPKTDQQCNPASTLSFWKDLCKSNPLHTTLQSTDSE